MTSFLSTVIILCLFQANLVLCDVKQQVKHGVKQVKHGVKQVTHGHKVCSHVSYSEQEYEYVPCSNSNVCRKKFKMTFIDLPPYFIAQAENRNWSRDLTDDVLTLCCGNCVKWEEKILQNITELTPASIKNSDFVFPVFASAGTKRLYGFYYLPYNNIPNIVYITKTTESSLESILSLYPLIIVCLLLAVVSGFVAWILETWSNEEEFPRPFFVGWFEGFWWSFVSMTTVGYGDKTPRSIAARLFSIIWIVIGMIAFGILSGQLTGQIVLANDPPPPKMEGKKVGALRYRDFDQFLISYEGGTVKRNEDATDFYSDILGLLRKLKKGEIDGFVLDQYTAMFVATSSNWMPPYLWDFFAEETTLVEKNFDGGKNSYGILLKHSDDYEYFKDHIRDFQLRLAMRESYYWVLEKNKLGHLYSSGGSLLFSPNKSYFQNTIIAVFVIIGFILIFGLFYELKRKNYVRANNRDEHEQQVQLS